MPNNTSENLSKHYFFKSFIHWKALRLFKSAKLEKLDQAENFYSFSDCMRLVLNRWWFFTENIACFHNDDLLLQPKTVFDL